MPFILESTIGRTLNERQRRTPGAIAFRYASRNEAIARLGSWREITFREFYQECELAAVGLKELGATLGTKIAILSKTRYEWALCDFAVMGVRGISVPIYPSTTANEVIHLLKHSDSEIVFVEDAHQLEKIYPRLGELPQVRWLVVLDLEASATLGNREKTLTLHDLIQRGSVALPRSPRFFTENLSAIAPEDLLTICYTSGTTGTPKGVMLSHASLHSVLEDCERTFREFVRTEHEDLLTFLPFSHIIGRLELMSTLVFGWTLNFAENLDDLPRLFKEVRPTIVFAVPRIFEKAYSHIAMNLRSAGAVQRRLFRWALKSGEDVYSRLWMGRKPSGISVARYQVFRQLILDRVVEGFGGRLRFAICGGAPLSREVGEYFQIVGIQILEGYGLTETFAPVTLNTPEALKFGTVGRPLPEVEIRIAPDGEICLRTKKLFQGYYKMPDETKAAFRDGWYLTGDIGFLDPEGYLHITDRKKDLIITSGGKNIAPQKIENLVKSSSSLIAECVVIGDRKKYLTALITLNRTSVQAFAEQHDLLFSQPQELAHNPKVLAEVDRVIQRVNDQLARFETVKRFMVLPAEFSIQGGELTPSLKVKRSLILRRYRSEIDQLYQDDDVTHLDSSV